MSFVPYQIVADRLLKLKSGYLFKIGKTFYKIKEVRRIRQQITEAIGVYDKKVWSKDAVPAAVATYSHLTGAIDLKRVTHLQYISCRDAEDAEFRWMEEPLLSMVNMLPLNTLLAGLTAPYEIDKWSYSTTMMLKLTATFTVQARFIIEFIEYMVEEFKGTPTQYLELLPSGEAVFHGV